MGHVHVNVRLKGAEGSLEINNVLIDTGASYTVMNSQALKKIGAIKTPHTVDLELGDGRVVKADVYVAVTSIEGREAPTLCVSFEGAKPVLGVLTLEGLGLKVNPTTGRLEPTRPKGIAYFYREECS